MNELTSQSIALLRQMVRIPSTTFEEKAVCDLLQQFLEDKGLKPKRIGDNLICQNASFDSAKPTLVLDAHIDTVPAAQGYTRDPLDPGDAEDIIYGLGSNDDGGSVVAMIAAMRHFYSEQLPVNLVLALSCQEERAGQGGARMLYSSEGPEETKNAAWVIVGEPTGMKAATSERGLLVLDAQAKGVSCHAARKGGVNALYIALDDITKLRAHRFEKVSPLMGEVGLNVTQINAGTAHNVIPDSCTFVVDIRPTDCYSNEEILSELQTLCKSTLVARNLSNRSSATFSGSPLLRTLGALGVETFSSPTTSDWMRTGKDAIKMGPGDSARSHRADEYVTASEIEGAVQGYISFIKSFCDGYTLE